MHRSGTSALAGALRLLGVDLGSNLLPATPFNPEGHFEHAEVVAYHERVLHALGRRWDDLRPLPPRWWRQPRVTALEGDLRELLRREFGGSRLWAVKDPRMCRLLPAWNEALRSLATDCRFVLIARDPREVARSLAARDGFPAWKAHLLYLDHMLAAERATRGFPRAFVTYDELLGTGAGALDRVGAELDLGWSAQVKAKTARVRAFLRPRLQPHASADQARPSRLERMTGECYAAFASAAAGDKAHLPEALEPVAALVRDVLLPWSRGMTADAERRVAEAHRELHAARRSAEHLARQVEDARRAHVTRDAADTDLQRALREREAEIGRARHSIQVLAGEIDASRDAHRQRDGAEAQLREALRAREEEVTQARTHIETLAREVAQARQAHEARDAADTAWQEALQARDAEVARARAHIESLATEIADARRSHEARDATETELRDGLRAREAEVDQARRDIEALSREIDDARRAHETRDRTEADLRQATAAREEELRAARESLGILGRELETAQSAITERTAREAELRAAVAAATAALEHRAEVIARLQDDLAEHLSLERELEAGLVDSEHELGDLKRTLVTRRGWWRREGGAPEAGHAGAVRAPRTAAHFALDALPAGSDGGTTTVTGWHISPAGRRLRRLVVRAGRHRFQAEQGQPRPDVVAANPGLAGAAASGFRVALQLPPGEHRLLFEAEYDDGSWHTLGARDLYVRRPPLAVALDAPRGSVKSGPVRFLGWCCHSQEAVTRLTLTFRGRTVECAYGLPRGDVEAAYPNHPGSGHSGFEVTCKLLPGRGQITLRAQLESGDILVHTSPEPLVVIPSLLSRSLRPLQTIARSAVTVKDVAAHLWRRGRHGGPMPALRTIPRRLADVVRLYRGLPPHARHAPLEEVAPRAPSDPFACWLRVNTWHERAHADLQHRLAAQPVLPRISVVMVPGSPEAAVEMLASLRGQAYSGWELRLAMNGLGADESLRAAVGGDARVSVCTRPADEGVVPALNAAAATAAGDFLVLATRPLALAPDALGELALHAAAHAGDDLVYTDHDHLDDTGRRHSPWLKPGWSPELLLSCMYLGPAWMVRRSMFEQLGGLRDDLGGAEGHDLVLRAAERARQVGHVPGVLFHDRTGPDSDAGTRSASIRVVREAFERRGVSAVVDALPWTGATQVLRPRFRDHGPAVALVVLPGRETTLPSGYVEALRASTYRPLHVVVAGAGAAADGPGSRAALANAAARSAAAEYLLFVEAGAVPRDPAWVSLMMGYARLPGVGAVGARIVRPDGSVQHEGIVRGARGGRGGVLFLQGERDGALHDGLLAANRSAVCGAGLLTPRRLFQELGGFDTGTLAETYHDVDYGYRLAQRGYRSVYVPGAELVLDGDLPSTLRAQPQAEACFRRRHPVRGHEFLSPYVTVGEGRLELKPRRLARDVQRPLRTLMCSFNLNREGAPHVQFEMTLRLKQSGVLDPVVFCHQDGPLREAYEAQGVEVVVGRHPLAGAVDARSYERGIASFSDVLRRHAAELVYANTIHSFYAIAAAEAAGLPSVWNLHESEPVQTQFAHLAPEVRARAWDCFRYPYRVLFQAQATRQVYQHLASEHNFVVVHGALDMKRLRSEAERWPRAEARRSLGLEDTEVALLLMGTICERKGQEDLPRALAGLPVHLWPSVRCFIVGDRGLPYGRRVQQARQSLPAGLRDRVHILPETAEPARFYQAADVFVCTSRLESFPRVTLLAMAHGLPLVTTPVFGIREQVRPGVNALLYEPGDIPGLLAILTRVLENEPLRGELAGQARAVLGCLDDFDAMVGTCGEIFREAWLSKA